MPAVGSKITVGFLGPDGKPAKYVIDADKIEMADGSSLENKMSSLGSTSIEVYSSIEQLPDELRQNVTYWVVNSSGMSYDLYTYNGESLVPGGEIAVDFAKYLSEDTVNDSNTEIYGDIYKDPSTGKLKAVVPDVNSLNAKDVAYSRKNVKLLFIGAADNEHNYGIGCEIKSFDEIHPGFSGPFYIIAENGEFWSTAKIFNCGNVESIQDGIITTSNGIEILHWDESGMDEVTVNVEDSVGNALDKISCQKEDSSLIEPLIINEPITLNTDKRTPIDARLADNLAGDNYKWRQALHAGEMYYSWYDDKWYNWDGKEVSGPIARIQGDVIYKVMSNIFENHYEAVLTDSGRLYANALTSTLPYWLIPTRAEWVELFNDEYTEREFVDGKIVVTSLINGNTISLPLIGRLDCSTGFLEAPWPDDDDPVGFYQIDENTLDGNHFVMRVGVDGEYDEEEVTRFFAVCRRLVMPGFIAKNADEDDKYGYIDLGLPSGTLWKLENEKGRYDYYCFGAKSPSQPKKVSTPYGWNERLQKWTKFSKEDYVVGMSRSLKLVGTIPTDYDEIKSRMELLTPVSLSQNSDNTCTISTDTTTVEGIVLKGYVDGFATIDDNSISTDTTYSSNKIDSLVGGGFLKKEELENGTLEKIGMYDDFDITADGSSGKLQYSDSEVVLKTDTIELHQCAGGESRLKLGDGYATLEGSPYWQNNAKVTLAANGEDGDSSATVEANDINLNGTVNVNGAPLVAPVTIIGATPADSNIRGLTAKEMWDNGLRSGTYLVECHEMTSMSQGFFVGYVDLYHNGGVYEFNDSSFFRLGGSADTLTHTSAGGVDYLTYQGNHDYQDGDPVSMTFVKLNSYTDN